MTGKQRIFRAMGFAVAVGMALAASSPAEAGRKRIVFEEEFCNIQVPKPQVRVFITRSNLDEAYDLRLIEGFLPKILEALETAPF